MKKLLFIIMILCLPGSSLHVIARDTTGMNFNSSAGQTQTEAAAQQKLAEKIAQLPVFDTPASTRTPFDWLLTPEKSQAGIYATTDGKVSLLPMKWCGARFAFSPI